MVFICSTIYRRDFVYSCDLNLLLFLYSDKDKFVLIKLMKQIDSDKPPKSESSFSAKSKTPKSQKVEVLLRIRPFLSSQDQEQFITVDQESKIQRQNNNSNANTITLNRPGNNSYMKFADISQGSSSQEAIYTKFKQTIMDSVHKNVNSTIFAYGQTGAGKTYTIIGDCPETSASYNDNKYAITNQSRGILPRALQMIFDQIRKRRDTRMSVCFYEIYNDKIFDLLGSSIKPLDIREGKNGQISIPGLLTLEIANLNQAINCLAQGIKNRVTSATHANIKSSRSHSVFQIKLQKLIQGESQQDFSIETTMIRIVDLAGSQKFKIPHDVSPQERQIKLQELKSINGSLSKLGHCISALTVQSRTHIPFRQSKLTRILSDSLLGSGKIRLIVCISPSMSAMHETISTLQFANQVKKAVFQRPTTSNSKKFIPFQQHQAILQQLEKQRKTRQQLQYIVSLKSENTLYFNDLKQSVNSVDLSGISNLDLMRDNDHLKQQVCQLRQKLKVYMKYDSQFYEDGDEACVSQYSPNTKIAKNNLRKSFNDKMVIGVNNSKSKSKNFLAKPIYNINSARLKTTSRSRSKSRSPLKTPQIKSSRNIKQNFKQSPFERMVKKHYKKSVQSESKDSRLKVPPSVEQSSRSIYQKSSYQQYPNAVSFFEYENKSIDVNTDYSRKHTKTAHNNNNKSSRAYGYSNYGPSKSPIRNPFVDKKIPDLPIKPITFQDKLRKFADKDNNFDQKIKKRLQQIKQQIKIQFSLEQPMNKHIKQKKKDASNDHLVSMSDLKGLWNR